MNNTENIGCLGFFLRLFGADTSKAASSAVIFPYRVRDDFLSPAELSFYHVVTTAVAQRATVCPKVGLGDIFFVSQPHENRAAFNRIIQKHVDFLVCEPRTMKPLCGIELDDATHARADRQARDEFVRQAFEAARLPLLRFPVQRTYNVQEIAALIEPLLTGQAVPVAAALEVVSALEVIPAGAVPWCPKCGVEMVKRTASKGERFGQSFYGCPHYPRCRQTVAISPPGSA